MLFTAHVTCCHLHELSVLQTVFAFVALCYHCPGAFQPFQDSDSGIICHHCSNNFLILMVLLMYISHPVHWAPCGCLALTKPISFFRQTERICS